MGHTHITYSASSLESRLEYFFSFCPTIRIYIDNMKVQKLRRHTAKINVCGSSQGKKYWCGHTFYLHSPLGPFLLFSCSGLNTTSTALLSCLVTGVRASCIERSFSYHQRQRIPRPLGYSIFNFSFIITELILLILQPPKRTKTHLAGSTVGTLHCIPALQTEQNTLHLVLAQHCAECLSQEKMAEETWRHPTRDMTHVVNTEYAHNKQNRNFPQKGALFNGDSKLRKLALKHTGTFGQA